MIEKYESIEMYRKIRAGDTVTRINGAWLDEDMDEPYEVEFVNHKRDKIRFTRFGGNYNLSDFVSVVD